jgi:eukaryotic-like serine/threonine-protein kinase
MEGRAKVTKEVLCEEARFILANVMAEARYGRQNRYEDIRRLCEGSVSIPFADYVGFLDKTGYLRHDRAGENLEVTSEGEAVVSGGNLVELTERAVQHFKKLRQSRGPGASEGLPISGATLPPPAPMSSMSSMSSGSAPPSMPSMPSAVSASQGSPFSPSGSSSVSPSGSSSVSPSAPGMASANLPLSTATPTSISMPAAMDRTTTTAAATPDRGDRGDRRDGSGAYALPRPGVKAHSSGGRSSAAVGGEIVELDSERYEKLANIGSGGIGTVYRARQMALGREVALKELRELFGFFNDEQRVEIVRRFGDVVKAWAQLAHTNILPIHDVSLDVEFPFVVTELAPNGSARRLINDAEEIPVEVVFKYLLQTLYALRAAHAQDIHHRGLKPEQLLLDAHGNIKVADFGFSRIVERDQAVIRQIYVGMGNVAYMAPELYTDPGSASVQGDIYALGIIFYELLTRKLPGRRSPMPSQIITELPAAVDDIFDKMTRDARSERYATIDDILTDFDRIKELDALWARPRHDDNPLAGIKWKPGAEEPMVGTPVEADGEADPDPERGKGGGVNRPYSYQQRRGSTTMKKP